MSEKVRRVRQTQPQETTLPFKIKEMTVRLQARFNLEALDERYKYHAAEAAVEIKAELNSDQTGHIEEFVRHVRRTFETEMNAKIEAEVIRIDPPE